MSKQTITLTDEGGKSLTFEGEMTWSRTGSVVTVGSSDGVSMVRCDPVPLPPVVHTSEIPTTITGTFTELYISRSFLRMLGAHIPPRNPGRTAAQRESRIADSRRRFQARQETL